MPRSSFACRRFWFKLMTAASKFKISTLSKKRARMREQNQNPHPPTKNAGRVGTRFCSVSITKTFERQGSRLCGSFHDPLRSK